MVLHYAHLCAAAGGVDAFLIGTEMPGLTTIRSGPSTYPAVQAYRDLLGDVRAILHAQPRQGACDSQSLCQGTGAHFFTSRSKNRPNDP